MKWISRKKSHTKSRIVWVGAGFSHCVTNGAMPLMRGFFDQLTREQYPALHKIVERQCCNLTHGNVEEILECLDREYALPVSREAAQRLGLDCDRETAKIELSQYCIDRLNCKGVSWCDWATELFASVAAGATTITTNYDTIADGFLSCLAHKVVGNIPCAHCMMRRILEIGCTCHPTEAMKPTEWRGSLLKLHDSIAWKICRNCDCAMHNCLSPDPRCRALQDCVCHCCGIACEAALVHPTRIKWYENLPELHRMWDAAGNALSEASELIFFGYSIPDNDDAIKTLMQRAFAQNEYLGHVWIIDRSPSEVHRRLTNLLPPDSTVEFELLEVPSVGAPSWWNRNLTCLTDIYPLETI